MAGNDTRSDGLTPNDSYLWATQRLNLWTKGNGATRNAGIQIGDSIGSAYAGISFYTANAGSTGVQRMVIDNSGNVGIGATPPNAKLDLGGLAGKGISMEIGVDSKQNIANGSALVLRSQTSDWNGYFDGYQGFVFNLDTDGNQPAGSNFEVRDTSNTSLLTVQHNGNVGIGTASPITKLDVNGDIKANNLYVSEASYSQLVNGGDTWVRIASGQGNSYGLFRLSGGSSSQHGFTTLEVSCNYPSFASQCNITIPNRTEHSILNVKAVRIVRLSTYDPYYVEVQVASNSSSGTTLLVTAKDLKGMSAYSSLAAGSIPSGYTADTVELGTLKTSFGTGTLNVTGGGSVGIGTTTPATRLQVNGQVFIGGSAGISGALSGLPFGVNDGSRALWIGSWNNTTIADYGVMYGETDLTGSNEIYRLNIVTGDNAGGTAIYDDELFIGNINHATTTKKGITIKNGNVGIGTTSTSYQLQLSTDSAAKPGTSTWTIASDARLKDIKAPFTRGLEALEGIHPIYFRYRADNSLRLPHDKDYVGIIAQDAQKAVPESVEVDDKGFLHVTNDAIIWTLFNAVKELYHKVQEKFRSNDRSLASIEARLSQLEELTQQQNREIKALERKVDEKDALNTKLKAENQTLKKNLCRQSTQSAPCR